MGIATCHSVLDDYHFVNYKMVEYEVVLEYISMFRLTNDYFSEIVA